jgi:Transposase IS4
MSELDLEDSGSRSDDSISSSLYDDGLLSDFDDEVADDNENIGETNTTITNTRKIGDYSTCPMDNFICTVDYADETLLEKAKSEIPDTLERLYSKYIGTDPSPLDLFKIYFTNEIIDTMLGWIKVASKPCKNITVDDIWGFILVDAMLMFYGVSPTQLYHPDNTLRYPIVSNLIPHARYQMIMGALNTRPSVATRDNKWVPTVQRCDDIIEVLQDFARHCTKIGFVKGMYVAIDDDVLEYKGNDQRKPEIS